VTAGRPGGRTVKKILLVCGLLAVGSPGPRTACQVSARIAVGARYSTALVKDSVVVPIELRPTVAPAFELTVRDAFPGPWTGDVTLDVSYAGLDRRESGSSVDAGSMTNIGFTLGLRRTLRAGVSARVGLGGLVYAASEPGIFDQGKGGLFPLVSLSAAYAPTFGVSRALELSLQYDLHRFITPALRSVGFNKARPVHRLAIGVSARVLGGSPR
jgi:hypothetical protein